MSTPPHNKNDKMELEIFDSFSKTVMRNTGRNIASASKIIKTERLILLYLHRLNKEYKINNME